MKKLILVISAFLITLSGYSQTDSTTRKMMPPDAPVQDSPDRNTKYNQGDQAKPDSSRSQKQALQHPDGFMMENGKMIQISNGKVMPMDKTVTLTNGTKIMPDGTYMTADGMKKTLSSGEHLDVNGKVVPMTKSNNPR